MRELAHVQMWRTPSGGPWQSCDNLPREGCDRLPRRGCDGLPRHPSGGGEHSGDIAETSWIS
jgi:hypothetical protein